jgi:hypothetical protein
MVKKGLIACLIMISIGNNFDLLSKCVLDMIKSYVFLLGGYSNTNQSKNLLWLLYGLCKVEKREIDNEEKSIFKLCN